jgi:DNA-directed RNA polymerase specialized sigma24 family protein
MSTPLQVVETHFHRLAAGPDSVRFPGDGFGPWLPEQPVPVVELRARLLHPSMPHAVRDGVLAEVVHRARRDGEPWPLVLAGMLLPGLRRGSARLSARLGVGRDEVEAEMLAGLFAALAGFDAERPRVAARLIGAAFGAARRAATGEHRQACWRGSGVEPEGPTPMSGHPELVLARAVDEGVVSAQQAVLIAETRLGGVSLEALAAELDLPYKTLHTRRRRAELLLAAWLRGQ